MRIIALAALLILSGCSDDDASMSPNSGGGMAADTIMFGGSTCSSSVDVIGPVETPGDPADPATTPSEPAPGGEMLLGCGDTSSELSEFPGVSQIGTGTIGLGSDSYAFSSAMIDSPWVFNERSEVDIVIHDGETKVRRVEYESGEVQIDFGMFNGTIALIAELSAAGNDGAENRTFEIHAAGNSSEPLEGDVAVDVLLLVDADGSGEFTSQEAIAITQGQITWVGSKPDISLTINALTGDGLSVSGSYSGDYVEVPAQ